jgi:3',5'-cyclic AMP phosphodiesterase CpdA
MQYLNTPLTQHFQLRNVETILDRVKAIAPDHILVTGDVTNFAHGSQFSSVHNLFLGLQAAFTGVPSGKLSGELWTVLPGNHDVTDEQSGGDLVRSHLGMFFRTFGSTYDPVPVPGRYDDAFPLTKLIVGRGRSSMTIRVIGLDSTVSAPVWKIGVNARGRIDDRQMERLNNIVGPHPSADLTLIAVHHHPVVIPHLVSELEDHFLSLDEKAGRQLIKLSANTGVSAILHGHFHHFSSWSVLTPQGRHMAIIGSPAGTLNIPDTYEQFLELREADRETSDGVQHGLAIYSHRRNAANDWDETYTGIFLPCL